MTEPIRRQLSHYTFTIPTVYSAGHPLSASEAQALNQHRARLIGNIAARWVNNLETTATPNGLLSTQQISDIQDQINEFSRTFEFSFKQNPSESALDKERRAVAEEFVRKTVPWSEEAQQIQIKRLLSEGDETVEREARRRLAAKQSVLFDTDPQKLGL